MDAPKKYSYIYFTTALFLLSAALHWAFAWFAYKSEQEEKGLPTKTEEYIVETMRDTMEKWHSEILQLIWQMAGLVNQIISPSLIPDKNG